MPTVVVLTALNLEFRAVKRHLTDARRVRHPQGTIFLVGNVPDGKHQVALAVIGEGGGSAAVLTERAREMFDPRALLFVGLAGSLKQDIALGDVVVSTKTYAVHGAKETTGSVSARPRAWDAPHPLDQEARHVDLDDDWVRLLPDPARKDRPRVHFKPIAATEVVLRSDDSPLARRLRRHYGDAAAVELESAGAAQAGHLGGLPVLTIRGISGRVDEKVHADWAGVQDVAAAHAAAFAVALIEALPAADTAPAASSPPVTAAVERIQHVNAQPGSTVFAVQDGEQRVYRGYVPDAPMWRPLLKPAAVLWRSDLLTDGSHASEPCALELHLAPRAVSRRYAHRELRVLPDELVALGRQYRLFGPDDAVRCGLLGETAVATRGGVREGRAGVAVHRDGQRSAWTPLPADRFGSVLDVDDVTGRLVRLISLLLEVRGPAPDASVVPAVGIEPAHTLSGGRAQDLPRNTASLGPSHGPLRVTATDSVSYAHLADATSRVAQELAARLVHAFRNSR